MNQEPEADHPTEIPARPAHRVRLPGFITDQEVGLGDVVKRATSAVGIRPCDDCAKRAAMLNRWMVFSGKNSKL